MNNQVKIACSLWSADLARLGESMKAVDDYIDSYHLDIMDNHYVPNLLFGPDTVKSIRGYTEKPIEVHLMIENVETMIDELIIDGADIFMLHIETSKDIRATLSYIRQQEKKVGVVLKNGDALESIYPLLEYVDLVVIMGTSIGIKGVGFNEKNYEVIEKLRKYIDESGYEIEIQIDGGIRKETVPKMIEMGAKIITAGSLMFNEEYDKVHSWVKSLGKGK